MIDRGDESDLVVGDRDTVDNFASLDRSDGDTVASNAGVRVELKVLACIEL